MADDYAKIFVWNAGSRSALVRRIKAVISGEIAPFDSVHSEVMEVDVRENEDRRSIPIRNKSDFLFAPLYLDVVKQPDAQEGDFVEAVAKLLSALWSDGLGAVAAASFEERLPYSGGLERLKDDG